MEGIEMLQAALQANPNAGDLIPGSEGLRKLRVSLPGRGKRGGARVIYYYRNTRNVIYLFSIYAKNQMSDLSTDDLKLIKSGLKKIKDEDYP